MLSHNMDQLFILSDLQLNLLNPRTTPEKALKLFSSPCFTPEVYKQGDRESDMIFHSYMSFIIMRNPDACMYGIWEEIFRKSVMYSQTFSALGDITCDWMWRTGAIPLHGSQVSTWLQDALETPNKCPNPYTRLELFRLIRIFLHKDSKLGEMILAETHCLIVTLKRVLDTFVYTISEIQPHRFYPSGGVDEMLFGSVDLHFMFEWYGNFASWPLQKTISTGIHSQLKAESEIIVYSNEAKFILHCIQLIGIFATTASSIIDPIQYKLKIKSLCNLFMMIIKLVNRKQNPSGRSFWVNFHYVMFRLPMFRPYIVETLRELTSAILKSTIYTNVCKSRDAIANNLNIYTKMCNLPGLLLSRQIHGNKQVHQHSLLLQNLEPLCKLISKVDDEKDEESDVEDINNEDSEGEYNSSDDHFDIEISDVEVNNVEESDIQDSDVEDSDDEDSQVDDSDSVDSQVDKRRDIRIRIDYEYCSTTEDSDVENSEEEYNNI